MGKLRVFNHNPSLVAFRNFCRYTFDNDSFYQMAMQDIMNREELEVYAVQLEVISGHGLPSKDMDGKSDPFVKIKIGDKEMKTKAIKDNLNPIWNAKYSFEFFENPKNVQFTVMDEDVTSNDMIGMATFDLSQQFKSKSGKAFNGNLKLKKKNNKKNAGGTILVKISAQKLLPFSLQKIADQQKETIFKQSQQINALSTENASVKKKNDALQREQDAMQSSQNKSQSSSNQPGSAFGIPIPTKR